VQGKTLTAATVRLRGPSYIVKMATSTFCLTSIFTCFARHHTCHAASPQPGTPHAVQLVVAGLAPVVWIRKAGCRRGRSACCIWRMIDDRFSWSAPPYVLDANAACAAQTAPARPKALRDPAGRTRGGACSFDGEPPIHSNLALSRSQHAHPRTMVIGTAAEISWRWGSKCSRFVFIGVRSCFEIHSNIRLYVLPLRVRRLWLLRTQTHSDEHRDVQFSDNSRHCCNSIDSLPLRWLYPDLLLPLLMRRAYGARPNS
jgi:hypothetical protein